MHTRAERKNHIVSDVSCDEVFDSSLDDLNMGRMPFVVSLTNQHIQPSDATKIILDGGSGSGNTPWPCNSENKHSLFISLDLDLKGMQIAKRNNANNKLLSSS
jgi:methylase of polypeptide subunit release factors